MEGGLMATNIRRRGQSWCVVYRRDGRQHWRSFKTKSEADLFLAQANVRRMQGQPEPQSRSTKLAEFAEEKWLPYTRARVGEQTSVNYENVVRVHLLPALGHLELRQVTRETLDGFVSDWSAGGPLFQERVGLARERERERARTERREPRPIRVGRSPKTISNAIVVLSAMLGKAVEWNYLAVNPAARLERPRDDREPGERMRPLDAGSVHALVDATEGQLARTLLVAAALTGARRGELLGLEWGDVDWTRNRVWVRRSIGLAGAKKPKSRRSVRAIALTPTLAGELEKLWKESSYKADTDPVFASSKGTPLDGRNVIRTVFEPALRRSGLPRMRFHDLRHTYASLLIAQDAHVKYISEQLGHASVQTTLDRYGHLFDQSYADESARLEKALADALTPASTASGLQALDVQTGAAAFHSGDAAAHDLPANAAV
jgi:integrase